MAPNRVQKRKSATSTTTSTPPVQTSQQPKAIKKPARPSRTPPGSPAKRGLQLTQGQKQALIDNLQLEITERARKLRAQYALQAQGLRTRLEIRVHRIPAALRKATIGELLKKHEQPEVNTKQAKTAATKAPIPSPAKSNASPVKIPQPVSRQPQPAAQRGMKRKSDELDADKENASNNDVENPKKRTRAGAPQVTTNQTRNPSKRALHPSQVLSPKSNNSRTIPRSPFKSALPSPVKQNTARPASPLKPSVTAPTTTSLARTATTKPNTTAATRTASKATTTAGGTTRAKRGAQPAPAAQASALAAGAADAPAEDADVRESNVSEATSLGTTIVRPTKKTAAAPTKAAAAKKTGTGAVARAVTAANKRAAASKEAAGTGGTAGTAGATVKGGRTLRKRG